VAPQQGPDVALVLLFKSNLRKLFDLAYVLTGSLERVLLLMTANTS